MILIIFFLYLSSWTIWTIVIANDDYHAFHKVFLASPPTKICSEDGNSCV